MRREYRIHPGIGIARVGNSPDHSFIGPEAPGVPPSLNEPDAPPDPKGSYKDDQRRIKRQGARFRIYEHTFDDAGALAEVREITSADAEIEWEVHLANRKAAALEFPTGGRRRNEDTPERRLVIDASAQKISGIRQGPKRLQGTFMETVTVPLGDLRTDDAGRLIVLGGFGKSQSVLPVREPLDFANNDGWCDDVSDGPVRARIRLKGSAETITADPARVIVAPPDFAPPIQNVITLYDVVYAVMTRFQPSLGVGPTTRVSFTKDIYPILDRVSNLHWVSAFVAGGHGPEMGGHFISRLKVLSQNDTTEGSAAQIQRARVFRRLRDPARPTANPETANMPKLPGGDAPVTLTPIQYERMRRWSEGAFDADWPGQPPAPVPLDALPARERPDALDRAALEACVGGGFFPGIEVGRIMRDQGTYDPQRPFRIHAELPPGKLTERMAVPWQADFRACEKQPAEQGLQDWWPAQRPNEVIRGATQDARWVPDEWTEVDMVKRWAELGFVAAKQEGDNVLFVERERSV